MKVTPMAASVIYYVCCGMHISLIYIQYLQLYTNTWSTDGAILICLPHTIWLCNMVIFLLAVQQYYYA